MKQPKKKSSKNAAKKSIVKTSGKGATKNAAKPRALPTSIFYWILGAMAGGAPVARAALRVMVWGALAMAVTAAVGQLFGAAV